MKKTKKPDIYTLKKPNSLNTKQFAVMNGVIIPRVPLPVLKDDMNDSARIKLAQYLSDDPYLDLTLEQQYSLDNQREINDYINRSGKFSEESKYVKILEKINKGEALLPSEQKEYERFSLLPRNQSFIDNIKSLGLDSTSLKDLVDKLNKIDPARVYSDIEKLSIKLEEVSEKIKSAIETASIKTMESGTFTKELSADIEIANKVEKMKEIANEIEFEVKTGVKAIKSMPDDEERNRVIDELKSKYKLSLKAINELKFEIETMSKGPIVKALFETASSYVTEIMKNLDVLISTEEERKSALATLTGIPSVEASAVKMPGLSITNVFASQNDYNPIFNDDLKNELIKESKILDIVRLKAEMLDIYDENFKNVESYMNGFKYIFKVDSKEFYPIVEIIEDTISCSYLGKDGKPSILKIEIPNSDKNFKLARFIDYSEGRTSGSSFPYKISEVRYDSRYYNELNGLIPNALKERDKTKNAFKLSKIKYEVDKNKKMELPLTRLE